METLHNRSGQAIFIAIIIKIGTSHFYELPSGDKKIKRTYLDKINQGK